MHACEHRCYNRHDASSSALSFSVLFLETGILSEPGAGPVFADPSIRVPCTVQTRPTFYVDNGNLGPLAYASSPLIQGAISQLFNSISNSPLLLVNTAGALNENLKESFKNDRGGWTTAQWEKELAAKPEDLGLTPRTYVVEGEERPSCKLFSDFYIHISRLVHMHTHEHKVNEYKNLK